MRMWPTPTVNDAQNATNPPSQRDRNSEAIPVLVGASTSAPLNPAWVEALQGFPAGWTDLSDEPSRE
jgi:hypothetical protein